MERGTHHTKEAKLLIGKATETAWNKRLQAIELLKTIESSNVTIEEVLKFVKNKNEKNY